MFNIEAPERTNMSPSTVPLDTMPPEETVIVPPDKPPEEPETKALDAEHFAPISMLPPLRIVTLVTLAAEDPELVSGPRTIRPWTLHE